jgi:SnoaL-like protein
VIASPVVGCHFRLPTHHYAWEIPLDRAQSVLAYFDAWNAHDEDAIVTTFAKAGTYVDPTTPGPLQGAAIGESAAALWAAFPDLAFELTN